MKMFFWFLTTGIGIAAVLFLGMIFMELGIRVMGRIERWFDRHFP